MISTGMIGTARQEMNARSADVAAWMLRSRPCGENCCKDAHLSETTSDHNRPARSAERFPDRTAPSIVAGSPVSVQSPARKRLLQAVALPGRLAFWAGV